MESDIKEIKSEIDVLWYEILKIREKEGRCRDSPQKEKVLRLMRELARRGEKEYFLRKTVEVRKGLARLLYQEGDVATAIDHLQKVLNILSRIKDFDEAANLEVEVGKLEEIKEARKEMNRD